MVVRRRTMLRTCRFFLSLWIVINSIRGLKCRQQCHHELADEINGKYSAIQSRCLETAEKCPLDSRARIIESERVCGKEKRWCCIRRALPDATSSECGLRYKRHRTRTRSPRIVGGRKTGVLVWPWIVSIERWNWETWEHVCGGVLVDKRMIVTAAHCLYSSSLSDHRVAIGDQHLQKLGIEQVIIHPEFNYFNKKNDIAIIITENKKEGFQYHEDVRPICLPDQKFNVNDEAGQECFIVGRGKTKPKQKKWVPRLRHAKVQLYDSKVCADAYNSLLGNLFGKTEEDKFDAKTNICAGKEGVDSCQGDSGGPLVCLKRGTNWQLAGIVSWGKSCGEVDKPGVYASAYHYSSWINGERRKMKAKEKIQRNWAEKKRKEAEKNRKEAEKQRRKNRKKKKKETFAEKFSNLGGWSHPDMMDFMG